MRAPRAFARGVRDAAAGSRRFARSAFAPTQRERDALCAFLAAAAAVAAAGGFLF